jgi:hypothetical protein
MKIRGKFIKESDMKKFGVLLLAFIVCFGLVAVMSGCWGSDDDDDNGNGVVVDEDPVDTALPQSTPAYAGTNSAAPLDTTVAKQAIELPWLIVDISEEIMDVWDIASLAVVLDTTQTFAGADTGTITIWDYIYESESDTLDTHRVITEWAADGYADSAGTYNDIMAADGTLWMETRDEQMYDGEAVEPAGVGTMTGEYYLDHTDFDSFALSTDTEDGEASGYMTMTEDYDYSVGDTVLWEMGYLADVAMADYSGTMVYAGILGASSTVAYDGSETSWVAVGTICLDDGDEEMVPFDGCYDHPRSLLLPPLG